MALIFIPQTIIFLWTENILVLLGQDPEVAKVAQKYVYYIIPGIFFFNMFETARRFLNAQLVFILPSIIQFTTLVLHFLWLYIFVVRLNFGIIGASISIWITYFLGK